MAAVGQTMTWSEQVGAWTGEGEAGAVISLAHPSPNGLLKGWQMASS